MQAATFQRVAKPCAHCGWPAGPRSNKIGDSAGARLPVFGGRACCTKDEEAGETPAPLTLSLMFQRWLSVFIRSAFQCAACRTLVLKCRVQESRSLRRAR